MSATAARFPATDVRLSVEQVSYAYAANPSQAPLFTLEATSFQAGPGEIVAILGPNASGKSTLLKLISGALAPLSGRVLLNGFPTHSLDPRARARRIAVVQQESRLLFPARVWEFVLQGRHPYSRGLAFSSRRRRPHREERAGAGGRCSAQRPVAGPDFRRRKAARHPGARAGTAAAPAVAR